MEPATQCAHLQGAPPDPAHSDVPPAVPSSDGTAHAFPSPIGPAAVDEFGLLRLHEALRGAESVDALRRHVALMPRVFVSMTQAGVAAPTVMHEYTALCDATVSRLVDLGIERHGPPPVPFAWLAFGSAGRGEFSLFSDMDNGLAYDDTDDASADDYFLRFATDVNQGLQQCGFTLDPHGVLATDPDWRMPASRWISIFGDCLARWDDDSVMRAAIGFDVRRVAGDLDIVPHLREVIRRAPYYSRFLTGIAQLGAEIPSPLGFRRRLKGDIDLKGRGILPVQNLARYYACAGGIVPPSTLERLAAVRDAGGRGSDVAESLRHAYETMAGLLARHHADAFDVGSAPGAPVRSDALHPEERAQLEAALRVVASVQSSLPRRASF